MGYNVIIDPIYYMKITVYIFILLVYCTSLNGQNVFKTAMLKTNPVQDDNEIGTTKSINSHNNFLQKAITNNNDLYHLYGLIYLYKDYYKQTDFVAASKYLIEAERFAKNSRKPGWIGIVRGYRATLTATVDNNQQLSIKQFLQAIANCKEAKDSLCIGESYEQISTKYNELGDYKKAHYYFNLGAPLLRKFGTDENMSAAYNNYSTVLINEKDFEKALIYIDSAIAIAEKNKLLHSELVFRSNKSTIYVDLQQYNKALEIIDYCQPINAKNNWQDNLASNYICRSIIYEKQGNFKLALEYLHKYQYIMEAISGENVKLKIASLEEKFKNEEQKLILKKKELELANSKRRTENLAWISVLMLSFLIIGLWIWMKQAIRNKKESTENQKNLTDLTNLLIQKNSLLLEQEDKLNRKSSVEFQSVPEETDAAFYNQRILTDSDWSAFKESFEKAYPNYITRLRNSHPAITEAEERLFLCLKLNLRTKETASMLGISNDSVKKNRSRLRKRLSLEAENDLAEYVRLF